MLFFIAGSLASDPSPTKTAHHLFGCVGCRICKSQDQRCDTFGATYGRSQVCARIRGAASFYGKRLHFLHSPHLVMKTSSKQKTNEIKPRRVALSIAQILAGTGKGPTIAGKRKKETSKRKKPLKPILPPKSMVVILKDKPEKSVYHRRMLDYKHCGLLQRYIGLGGKILSRRQTRLTAKQQRYVAKTIKTARIMGLLPFTNKERAFFRSLGCMYHVIVLLS